MAKIVYYRCPECGYEAPRADWDEFDVDCDSCGGHSNYRCPDCGWTADPYLDWEWEPSRTEGEDPPDPWEGWERQPMSAGNLYTRRNPDDGAVIEIAFVATVGLDPGDTLEITYRLAEGL